MFNILAACLGILLVAQLPKLPPLPESAWLWLALLLPAGLWLIRATRALAALYVGVLWGLVAGHQLLQGQLPPELEGEDLLIRGSISGLPEARPGYFRFEFAVQDYLNLRPDYRREMELPRKLQLSWYGRKQLRAGQVWTLKIKLSRPRGFVNEGGFDYQRSLLSRGIGATGYVRPSTLNQPQATGGGYPVQGLREDIRAWLNERLNSPQAALLVALAVGDSSAISDPQWNLLRNTGTSHLMAISGLHIGLAALVGYWLGLGLRALLSLRPRWLPGITNGGAGAGRPPWLDRLLSTGLYALPSLLSCSLALAYSALAGFALPTQRALVMVLLFNLALLSRRTGSSPRALALAMLLVLMLDPLAGGSMGFWLSFGAVAVLLYSFQNRCEPARGAQEGIENQLAGQGRQSWLRLLGFGRAQLTVFVGLALPLFAMNQSQSLISPLANAVAIPLVSFLVAVPLLAALALRPLSDTLAEWLLRGADWSMGVCVSFLDALDGGMQAAGWFPGGGLPGAAAILLGSVGLVVLLAPRGIPGRWLGLVLLLPVVIPDQGERPPLEITVLDVGQGLAAVIITPQQVLVYDTGPAYSDSFNAGEAILVPFLRSRGISRVDTLIISHGDGDHAGGALGLLASVPAAELLSGELLPEVAAVHPELAIQSCHTNRHWQWQGVGFRLLASPAPSAGPFIQPATSGNDQSCILLIEFAGKRILLPGDIEAPVEKRLLEAEHRLPGLNLSQLELVIAPHHGSASSSIPAFVQRVSPAHVVYSAAWRSPYGHPHPDVQARYAQVGSAAYHTGHTGQLRFIWDEQGQLEVLPLRQSRPRYWFDRF